MHTNRTVLVIDDDPAFRQVMSELLGVCGWRVLEASDGHKGLEMAREHLPGVILCDLLMPGCNGFHFCRSLRADPRCARTPIVVTSGRSFESDKQDAFEAGANQYFTKPLDTDKLLRYLSNLEQVLPATEEHTTDEFGRGGNQADVDLKERLRPQGKENIRLIAKFWGVRGSIATPGPATVLVGGNTTCLEVRVGEEIIILDAGTGLRLLGRALTCEFGEQPINSTLLISHTHWDHIQGLPFFVPIYQPQNHLHIIGFEGARHGLETVLSRQMESPFFPINFNQLPGNIQIEELKQMQFRLGAVQVDAAFANHPGICVGYRLRTSSGALAFFPDNETRCLPESRHDPGMLAFLKDVDVLVIDAQYDKAEYQAHVGWGHGCVDSVVSLAVAAGVKELYLFHHDPDHDDRKVAEMEAHGQNLAAEMKSELKVRAAREGEVVTIG